jgi:hypothetical protein
MKIRSKEVEKQRKWGGFQLSAFGLDEIVYPVY